ncbi:MAG: class I SAM-dependent methyltransferase [Chloroflexi bacterium]|nr:MAG: class I SAM-dependent methyltransferase [Chloroflexota bacterium]
MAFDAETAGKYDEWFRSPKGKYADAMEKELFLRLAHPVRGQTLLDVGCGTGHNLEFFRQIGLQATGVDASEPMLGIASSKLGLEANVSLGRAESLGFKDRSFDIVALITVLEFSPDPAAALSEAARVAREEVYLGVLNKASLLGITRRLKGRFRQSIYNQARFFTIWELERMVSRELGGYPHTWQSALLLPLGWHARCHRLDRLLSFRRNPLGAFLGVCIRRPGF